MISGFFKIDAGFGFPGPELNILKSGYVPTGLYKQSCVLCSEFETD